MKKHSLLFLLALSLVSTQKTWGQAYTTLATDPAADLALDPNGTDIKSCSYRIDQAHDSIWFKVETYNAVATGADFGFVLAIDTNKVVTDGTAWGGSNTSMKYDQAVYIYQNSWFPGYYYEIGKPGATTNISGDLSRPDNKTFIFRFKMSELDQDGKFNIMIGSGFFDVASSGSVIDQVPNTNYLTIPVTTSVSPIIGDNGIRVYPNPVTDRLHWNTAAGSYNSTVSLYSITGQEVLNVPFGKGELDLSMLEKGLYIFVCDGVSHVIKKQ